MKTIYTIQKELISRKLMVIVSLLFIGWRTGYTQNTLSHLSEFNEENYKEEIYIQTDRDLYIVGEQVWFKVYKLNAITRKPDNVSKVVYIELLNHAGYPVKQVKLKMAQNSGSASFRLSDTLSSGNYLLRAYTSWMQNYSAKDFFFKQISIINPFHGPERIGIHQNKSLVDTILFYPEGGVLISGIKSKVGFRVINRFGKSQSIDAAIINDKKDTVCLVHTEKPGFGTFYIVPDHRDNYRLIYSNGNKEKKSFPLGVIDSTGISLSLGQKGLYSPLSIKINMAAGFMPGEKSYFVLLISKGLVRFIKEVNLDRQLELVLNSDELPYGVSQIVLTDINWEPISHRWIYNGTKEKVHMDVKLNKQRYSPREKVKVEISSKDMQGNPIPSDLSVSVSKTCLFNESRMNLNNRYKYICALESLNVFDEETSINDCLLFYAGTGDYLKNELNPKNTYPRHIPEIDDLLLGGTLLSSHNGEPVANVKVLLSIVGNKAKNQIYKTDDSGDFYFVINDLGLLEIVIQPLESDLKTYHIKLKSNFSNSYDHIMPGQLYLDTGKLEQINKAIVSMQIENIYKPFQKVKPKIPTVSSPVDFYGEPEYSVKLSDYIQLTTVQEVVKEIVPYISTRKMEGISYIRIRNEIDGQIFKNNPLVLVDGIPYDDFERILKLSSTEMERIDVINRRYFIDDHTFDGIVHFITKRGNLEVLGFDHSIFRQAYQSYPRTNSFYAPEYRIDSSKSSALADFRNTLFWNADLSTNQNGTVDFEFFTSDEAGKYTIFIEGIAADGKTGVISRQIVVN